VLDRASKFSDPAIVRMLKQDFIPVAIDQWYQRNQDDVEGRFYQKIVAQGPRTDLNATTQGSYIASANGELLGYNNNFGPDRIRKLMTSALARKHDWSADPLPEAKLDDRFSHSLPDGAVVIQVNAKVLDGYAKPRSPAHRLLQSSIARDNLWILAQEQEQLKENRFPTSLSEKLARFHLIDNSRGEPPMWLEEDVKSIRVDLRDGKISGRIELQSNDGRSYKADVMGHVEFDNGVLSRFDLVAKGLHEGEGQWTKGAPSGEFPLAVAFRMADPNAVAYRVRPQALKAFGQGYLWIGQSNE